MNSDIPVFKIQELNSSGVKNIYVMGNFPDNKLEKLWKSDPDNIVFDEMFGQNDKILFKSKKVFFIDFPIHLDDRIGTIKLKIAKALNLKYSVNEIYLYSLVKEVLNPNYIYQVLTQNNQLTLTKLRFNQFLSNIKNEDNSSFQFNIEDKEEYTFEDILQLDLINKNYYLAKPLGQKLQFSKEYPFVVNPYEVDDFDSFLENSRKDTTTSNNSLLLNTENLFNRNIYLCLAPEVFKFSDDKKISVSFTSKIYYPFLYNENISSIKELEKEKKKLIKQTKDQLTPSTFQTFKIIDDLHRISRFGKKSNDFELAESGIKNFNIEITPPFFMNLPIESIFKQINSDMNFPLIKFNPSIKKENIYRLYSNKLSTKGQKIPYLNKAMIFKLIKGIGRESSISFYTESELKNEKIPIILEIYKNAFISVYNFSDMTDYYNINELDKIISDVLNVLIVKLRPFLQQGGYDLKYFRSILDSNIEIKRLTYNLEYNISKEINFNSISTCFSTIFVTENGNIKEGYKLRYKKVSNYSEYDSQQAFIIDKQNQNLSAEQIIELLIENFSNMTLEKATDLVLSVANEEQIIKGTMRNRGITIKQNPGFFTNVSYNKIKNTCLFSVDSINNINYLPLISTYVSSLLHINQDIKTTGLNISNLQKLCSSNKASEIKFNDLVAVNELSFQENEIPLITEEKIDYENIQAVTDQYDNNMDDLLDVLGFDDFGEEDDMNGGADSSDSPMLSESPLSSNENKSIPDISEIVIEDTKKNSSPDLIDDIIIDSSPSNSKTNTSNEENTLLEESKESSPELPEENSKKVSSPVLPEESSQKESSPVLTEESAPLFIEETKQDQPIEVSIIEESKIPTKSEEKNKLDIQSIEETNKENIILESEKQSSEKLKKSVDGLKLANPYYFQSLLEKRDPKLFLSLKDGKFDGYSRMCPSSTRRQPVILNQSEFDKVLGDKNNGLLGNIKDGEYSGADVIKYGSSPSNNYYYMCPKYWCLLNNEPLTQKQVDNGECGGKNAIIPKNSKSVPPGKSIFEFYEDSNLRYPGFHKELTPNGHCIPCCYKLPQNNKRKNCYVKEDEQVKISEKIDKKDQYIKGPEKFPLADGRWGFLPLQVNLFLQDINSECKTNKFTIAPNSTCILRLGVENSEKQSFIACIATILFYGVYDNNSKQPKIKNFYPNSKSMVPSISEMKELFINSISKEKFSSYQNADLINIFGKNDNYKSYSEKLDSSFSNFKNFLLDDEIIIDYTYLWDIICLPNPNLFPNGINMIILDVVNNDTTNNVELICPTNVYSTTKYDSQKGNIIIIKQGNYYEPIFSYKNEEKRIQVSQIFRENEKNLSNSLKLVFQNIIKPIMNEKCKPVNNLPSNYDFIAPININIIQNMLEENNFMINNQLVNNQGKTIGFGVQLNSVNGYIPCYPSSPIINLEKVNLDEFDWSNYENTLFILKSFFKDNVNKIVQITEEKVIVGFLSPTNQFIQIDPPLQINEADNTIKSIQESNYLSADIATELSNDRDTERIDFIKRITLETKFYNSFRNTLKIEINKFENLENRREIENICNNNFITYQLRLDSLINLVSKLLYNKVSFVSKEEGYNINEINDIYTCIVLPIDKCNENKPVCVFDNGKCSLVIPKLNLITNSDNEQYYYGKLADELLRYNRIKSFILNPQTFISFGKIGYNLKNNEILILQSLITQSYFENKIPIEMNKYAIYNSYDNTHPQNEAIENIVKVDLNNENKKQEKEKIEEKVFEEGRKIEDYEKMCKIKKTKIISKKWKNCFPDSYNELNYEATIQCSYKLVKDILFEIKQKNITQIEIKSILINQYKLLITNYNLNQENLLKIFIAEGKKLENRGVDASLLLEELILSEEYWLSNVDVWVLLNYFKINSVFISPFAIRETKFKLEEIFIYNDDSVDYLVCIILPSQIKVSISSYKLVVTEKSNIKISKSQIKMSCFKNIININDSSKIQEYINTFKPKKPIVFDIENNTIQPKKTKQTLIIED